MRDKIITIGVVILIIYLVLTYPLFVSVEDNETKCSNLLGQTVRCD